MPTAMGSFMWTPEEAKYLKAIFRWQESQDAVEKRKKDDVIKAENRKPTDEFRILVVGAKETGKTSLLTRFGQNTFRGEGSPPDPFYERGCRRPIVIDGQTYVVDALEMPSRNLSSNPLLEQAVAITEAAVLVYDVRSAESFRMAKDIGEFIREITVLAGTGAGQQPTQGQHRRREYGLILVGNKSDVADGEKIVTWADGRKAALGLSGQRNMNHGGGTVADRKMSAPALGTHTAMGAGSGCAFLEVSAKTGDNVEKMFVQIGKELLKLKWINQQRRREEAERLMRMGQGMQMDGPDGDKRRTGFWRSIRTPFAKK